MSSKKLPFEILYRIFDDLESIKDLINCRLVCKEWDPAAEMAMFGKRIYIKSEKAATKFYHHLLKKPSNGGLVKHLSVRIQGYKSLNTTCFKQLLPLVFTPRLEDLDTNCMDDADYQTMIDIAQQTQAKFNLKAISQIYPWELYKKVALTFKDTLETLDLGSHLDDGEFLRLLGQFKQLKTVMVNYEDASIYLDELKLLVDNCPVLERLEITGDLTHNEMTKAQVERWFEQNDSQLNQTLKVLTVGGSCWTPCIIEYFNLKYAKIEIGELDLSVYEDFDDDELPHCLRNLAGTFKRAIQALNKIPTFDFVFFLPKGKNVSRFLSCIEDHDHVTHKRDDETMHIHAEL